MPMQLVIPFLFGVFVLGIVLSLILHGGKQTLRIPVCTSFAACILTIPIATRIMREGTFFLYGKNLVVDYLSLYHMVLVNIVFLLASLYGTGYFKGMIDTGRFPAAAVRRYCMLWQAFQAMLLVVLMSNNIGIMWVALEATTLVSAFLILSDSDSLSIEAMWKYLLICSVGIVFAFMGTVLTVTAAKQVSSGADLFLFSRLAVHPELIDPRLMLFAFIFIVVGYGTKAGLAPMHTWLPDAHSQAPTPVSAVFSGVMLSCALFCIMRYLPIAEGALGKNGEARSILLVLGFVSLVFSAVFIPVQRDLKRFLAYSSVEHIGIIAIGLGLGGLGLFAALFHTMNHALSKTLAFFAAGHITDRYETRDIDRISGAVRQVPLWGGLFFLSVLILIGVAPFSIFMSELIILKEAFFAGKYFIAVFFLFSILAVFLSALRHAMKVSFGEASHTTCHKTGPRFVDGAMAVVCIAALLIPGLWIPAPLASFLKALSAIVERGITL